MLMQASDVASSAVMSTCWGLTSDKAVGKSCLRLKVAVGIVSVPITAGVPVAAATVRFLSLVASIGCGRNCGCPGAVQVAALAALNERPRKRPGIRSPQLQFDKAFERNALRN